MRQVGAKLSASIRGSSRCCSRNSPRSSPRSRRHSIPKRRHGRTPSSKPRSGLSRPSARQTPPSRLSRGARRRASNGRCTPWSSRPSSARAGGAGANSARSAKIRGPVVEYVPGRFVVHDYRREKWACGTCKVGVVTAPAPERVIARSPTDASLLAHIVVQVPPDHTPLHRLHRIYDRSGVTIPVSTLSEWAGAVGDLVAPLVERIQERIVADAHVAGTGDGWASPGRLWRLPGWRGPRDNSPRAAAVSSTAQWCMPWLLLASPSVDCGLGGAVAVRRRRLFPMRSGMGPPTPDPSAAKRGAAGALVVKGLASFLRCLRISARRRAVAPITPLFSSRPRPSPCAGYVRSHSCD